MVTRNGSKSAKSKAAPAPAPVKVKFSHRLLLNAKAQLQREKDKTPGTGAALKSGEAKQKNSSSTSRRKSTDAPPKSGKGRRPTKKQVKAKNTRRSNSSSSLTRTSAPSSSNRQRGQSNTRREEITKVGPYAEGSIANIVLNRVYGKQEHASTVGPSSSSLSFLHEESKSSSRKSRDQRSSSKLSVKFMESKVSKPSNDSMLLVPENRSEPAEAVMNAPAENEKIASRKDNSQYGQAEISETTVAATYPLKEIAAVSAAARIDSHNIPRAANPSKRGIVVVRRTPRARLLLRSRVENQPRPSPPFSCLVKVVEGPYAGKTGYLSPTGTYGYSIISDNTTGWFGTVNDSHVREAQVSAADTEDAAKPSAQVGKKKKQGKRGPKAKKAGEDKNEDDISIERIFLGRLYECIEDDVIAKHRRELEQLRVSATAHDGEHLEEDAQTLEDAVRVKEEKLHNLVSANSFVKLAAGAFKNDPLLPTKPKKKSARGRKAAKRQTSKT